MGKEHQKHQFFFFSSSQQCSSKFSTITVPADALYAEIIWALTVALKSFSVNSCDDISKTFKAMLAKFIVILP